MSIASSVARSVARPVARAVAGLGGGGSVWTPASLATLRQWLSDNYYSSPVGGLQVIESLESHGTVRAPQPGACALFDGVNDYASAIVSAIAGATSLTVALKFKQSTLVANQCLIAKWNYPTQGTFALQTNGADETKLTLYIATSITDDGTGCQATTPSFLVADTWHSIVFVFDGSLSGNGNRLKIYADGTNQTLSFTGSVPAALTSGSAELRLATFESIGRFLSGCEHDVRIYSTAKDATFAANYHVDDFTNLDRTGILAHWYLNNRAGTVAYDASGNGHDLTLSGPITEATFWAEDAEITANPANVLGYTLSGSTVIPRDESDITKDVQGNALQYTGLSPYPVTIDTPVWTSNGTSDYATAAGRVLPTSGDVTISGWLYQSTLTANDTIAAEYSAGAQTFYLGTTATGFEIYFYSTTSAYVGAVCSNCLAAGTYQHIAVTLTGSTIKAYVDGQEVSATPSNGGSFSGISASSTAPFQLATYASGTAFLAARYSGFRVHSVGKSAAEVLAMFQGFDDRTSLLASWKCQEGPGTANTNVTLYDDSGNGNHLTVVGGTVADQWDNRCPGYVRDHAFEYGGRVVYGNQLAYSNFASGWTTTTVTLTVSGSTDPNGGATASKITPNSTGNTRSIYNTTTVSAKHISVCCKADGVNWINLINVGGTLPAAWFNVSTGTVGTVVAGYTATIEDLGTGWFRCRLFKDDGSPFIYVQVSITNSDNTTTVTASGSNGVLVWEPVATNIKGPLVPTSGTAITGDVFIPLVPGTLLCADGNAATLSAGKRGNPYSQMIPSPFDAAELNKFGFTSATRITATETFDDASSIADTGFGRIGADGIDREFLADEALTGADLAAAQAYTA